MFYSAFPPFCNFFNLNLLQFLAFYETSYFLFKNQFLSSFFVRKIADYAVSSLCALKHFTAQHKSGVNEIY